MATNLYALEAQALDGSPVPLANYAGKTLLVVNTASMCGFTPQLKKLEELRQRFAGQPFEVLAFPSPDFNQEHAQPQQIQATCQRFSTSFPIMAPVHVKGPEAHPVFQYLGSKAQNGLANARPRWNFYKYLIGPDGTLQAYWWPFTAPTAKRVVNRIEALLPQTQRQAALA